MSLPAQRSAVVVGAGVGGLATTVALRRAGWRVVVHERAAELQAAGTGLVLWPNAVRALAALGLDEQLQDRATVLRRSGLRRPDGRWLSRVDVTDLGGPTPVLGVLRPDLVDLLAGAVGPEDLRLGSPLTDLTAVGADLVVGADGARSTVRQANWPEQPPARYRGYTAWRAVVPATGLTSDGATETWGRGERFGVVPVGRGQTYLYATANAEEGERAGDELAELRRRFGRWHAPIPALLDALEAGAVLRHDVHAVEPALTELHRGRVVLVGDAAHAMEPNLGQGACLALEDAVVLADALRAGADVSAGLAAYSAARTRRVADLARRSRQIGVLGQTESRVVVRARDALVRLTPASAVRRASQRTIAWHPPATARPGTGTT